MDRLADARHVFDIEIKALEKTRDALDGTYLRILDAIVNCNGKVIITGMGKPGHIASKLAATFSSLGTPAYKLHPGDAMHGDLGVLSNQDIVIAISYSGESEEIVSIIPSIKMIGTLLIGITGNADSSLAMAADIVQVLPDFDEACNLGLAPTSSTTVELCYGDSLAVVASSEYGFSKENFAMIHPAGSLGKKLIAKVEHLMKSGKENAVIHVNSSIKDAIIELSEKGLGILDVIDENEKLLGVITDGDLRRLLQNELNIYQLAVQDIMTKKPRTIDKGELAVTALHYMKTYGVSCLPVLRNEKLIGTIRIHDIINYGIF